jgi:hypothetical protein
MIAAIYPGAELIRHGTTRAVICLPFMALKLAKGERGRRCNLFERDTFRRVDERRRAMLCPVLCCDPFGFVLIARAAKPLTERERDELWASDGFPDWDYVPPDEGEPFEYKPSDWGWLDGKLVALDYSAPAL